MNIQDLTADGTKTSSTSGGSTGEICNDTSLYTASDKYMQFIEYIENGAVYPYFPGGNGNKKCTWSRLSLSTDGSKTSFTSVKVESGTL